MLVGALKFRPLNRTLVRTLCNCTAVRKGFYEILVFGSSSWELEANLAI